MQDENRVVARGVQASPDAVGDGDRLDATAELQIDRSDLHREAGGIEHGRRLTAPADDPQPASVADLLLALNGVWPLDHLRVVSHRVRIGTRFRSAIATFRGKGEAAHKETPAEAGVRLHAVPLSRRSLCRIWHLAANWPQAAGLHRADSLHPSR